MTEIEDAQSDKMENDMFIYVIIGGALCLCLLVGVFLIKWRRNKYMQNKITLYSQGPPLLLTPIFTN